MDAWSIAVAVGGALVSIGAALAKRPEAPAPPPRETQPSLQALPAFVTREELAEVRRVAEGAATRAAEAGSRANEATSRSEAAMLVAGGARQATDQMLPRLARVEEDVREQEGALRGMDRTVVRIAERLRVKVEESDGKRREST